MKLHGTEVGSSNDDESVICDSGLLGFEKFVFLVFKLKGDEALDKG